MMPPGVVLGPENTIFPSGNVKTKNRKVKKKMPGMVKRRQTAK
jgi:hypothetical protein